MWLYVCRSFWNLEYWKYEVRGILEIGIWKYEIQEYWKLEINWSFLHPAMKMTATTAVRISRPIVNSALPVSHRSSLHLSTGADDLRRSGSTKILYYKPRKALGINRAIAHPQQQKLYQPIEMLVQGESGERKRRQVATRERECEREEARKRGCRRRLLNIFAHPFHSETDNVCT
jgi:hypothetical protein